MVGAAVVVEEAEVEVAKAAEELEEVAAVVEEEEVDPSQTPQ